MKVGKSISFPLDLPSYLPAIIRTNLCIESAQSAIELPMNQIKYSMFWFMKLTQFDEIAFKHLLGGNISQAKDIWSKKDGVSAQINLTVCGMIEGNFTTVALNADKLFQLFAEEYCKTVNETIKLSTSELIEIFINTLKSEWKVNVANFANISGTSATWQKITKAGLVEPIIEMITGAIAEAKIAKGSRANYSAGIKLMNSTKKPLLQLKSLLGISDMQYQIIADKLAQAILQRGINYFNDSEDDDAPQKAMNLQGYALSIAVGQVVKGRCKNNVDILNNIVPGYKIKNEVQRIGEKLDKFKKSIHTIYQIETFVDGSKTDLSSIVQKLGKTDSLYLNISSAVVSAAINALVEKINAAQKIVTISYDLSSLRGEVSSASTVMSKIASFDMTTECRNYFNKNNTALKNINSQLINYGSHQTTESSPRPSGASSSDGCYIATMVYGDYDHPQVMVLRDFRDNYLDKRSWGKQFIKFIISTPLIGWKGSRTISLSIR